MLYARPVSVKLFVPSAALTQYELNATDDSCPGLSNPFSGDEIVNSVLLGCYDDACPNLGSFTAVVTCQEFGGSFEISSSDAVDTDDISCGGGFFACADHLEIDPELPADCTVNSFTYTFLEDPEDSFLVGVNICEEAALNPENGESRRGR
jgi:hypothetical protein